MSHCPLSPCQKNIPNAVKSPNLGSSINYAKNGYMEIGLICIILFTEFGYPWQYTHTAVIVCRKQRAGPKSIHHMKQTCRTSLAKQTQMTGSLQNTMQSRKRWPVEEKLTCVTCLGKVVSWTQVLPLLYNSKALGCLHAESSQPWVRWLQITVCSSHREKQLTID